MDLSITRRDILQAGAGLAAAGVLGETAVAAEPAKNVYEALGVTRVINAQGTFTALGGSVMPPEVVAAWAEASKSFVDLVELHDKASAKIAQLLGVEAALVTTGAAGAIFLGTAAAITRGDAKLIARLPDTTGMKNEVLIQKAHRSCYDNQLTGVGGEAHRGGDPADDVAQGGQRPDGADVLHELPGGGRKDQARGVDRAGPQAQGADAHRRRGRRAARTRGSPSTPSRASTSSPSAAARRCAGRTTRACCSAART